MEDSDEELEHGWTENVVSDQYEICFAISSPKTQSGFLISEQFCMIFRIREDFCKEYVSVSWAIQTGTQTICDRINWMWVVIHSLGWNSDLCGCSYSIITCRNFGTFFLLRSSKISCTHMWSCPVLVSCCPRRGRRRGWSARTAWSVYSRQSADQHVLGGFLGGESVQLVLAYLLHWTSFGLIWS